MHFSSPNNSRTESDDAQPLRYEVAGFIMLCNPLIGSLSLSVVLGSYTAVNSVMPVPSGRA